VKCPFCGADDTAVVNTRLNDEGDIVRRRRKCNACDKRFTTYERVELQLPLVVKKNGSRADYDRDKLQASLMLALRKRPVTTESIDAAIERIEERLLASGEREVPTEKVGELVMRELRKLDKIAYVRFAVTLGIVLVLVLIFHLPISFIAIAAGGGMKLYARAAQVTIDASPLLAEVGIRLAQLSAVIAILAFAGLRLARTTFNPLDPARASALVTVGIYRVSRNPMYLSLLLLLVAYAVRLGAWVEWLGPAFFAAYVTRFQIIPEERILTEKFGEAYLAYQRRTRRWL